MDASNFEEAAKILASDDKSYYKVPTNLYELSKKPNGKQTLIIKDADLTHFRKYKAGEDGTIFFCCGCYQKQPKHEVKAYHINGIIKAPYLHACLPIPVSQEERIKNVKAEIIDSQDGNPSVTMPASSNVVKVESNAVDDPNRPISRESDVIYLEFESSKAENVQTTKKASEYRTITSNEYVKAYSGGGKKGRRIIVFEENDKTLVKQYIQTHKNYWFCLGCFRSERKHNQAFLKKDKTFMVPKVQHCCEAMRYEAAKEEQKAIIEKYRIFVTNVSVAGNNDRNDKNGEEADSINNGERNPSAEPETTSIKSRLRSPSARTVTSLSSVHAKPLKRPIKKRKIRSTAGKFSSSSSSRREIKQGGYVLGVGAQNQPNGRIHAFVDENKTEVHEYCKNKKNSYYCRRCILIDKTKTRRATINNSSNSLWVACDHICQPVKYSFVQQEQESIKQKYSTTASNVAIQKSSLVETSASSLIVTSSTTATPSQITPIYSGARLTAASASSSFLRASPIPTSSKTLLHRPREQTPYAWKGGKKKLGRPRKNVDPPSKKSKPNEDDIGSRQIGESIGENTGTTAQSLSKPVSANSSSTGIDANATKPSNNSSMSLLTPVAAPRPPPSRLMYIPKKVFAPRHPNSFIRSFNTLPSSPKSFSSALTVIVPKNRPAATISSTPLVPTTIASATASSTVLQNSTATITLPKIPPLATVPSIPITSPPIPQSSLSTLPPPLSFPVSSPTPPSTIPSTQISPLAAQFILSSKDSTAITFNKPSESFLKKCCEKLLIIYSNEAYKFWSTILIDKILTSSIPDQVYVSNEEKYHGWECISLYFTGAEDKAGYIREQVNKHLHKENSKTSILDRDGELKALFAETITEVHFELLSKWLDCRIGVFSNNVWHQYGHYWSAKNADIPLLLMEFKKGKYFIVLSLK